MICCGYDSVARQHRNAACSWSVSSLTSVKITGALLADAVKVVDDKLDIQGGFVRFVRAGPDRVASLNLIVFTELEASDIAPKVNVEFVTPSGDSQMEQVDMPGRSTEGGVCFAYWPLWIPVETDGQYVLTVSGDEGAVSLPLTVHG